MQTEINWSHIYTQFYLDDCYSNVHLDLFIFFVFDHDELILFSEIAHRFDIEMYLSVQKSMCVCGSAINGNSKKIGG